MLQRRDWNQTVSWSMSMSMSMSVLALAGLGLAALRYLDQSVTQAGLWLFVGVTLTTGFFHGALDIVLIQREFASTRRWLGAVVVYGAAVVVLAILCAQSNWLMVLALLAMSVWHFGEPYGRWAHGTWVHRVVAGGAPVMLPALLAAPALQHILPMAVGLDSARVWTIWQTMAWCWVGLCGVGMAVLRRRLLSKPLWAEVAAVFALNVALTPLMAFSIYFGLFHAGSHIYRVIKRRHIGAATAQTSGSNRTFTHQRDVAIAATSLGTLALLLVLAWYLQSGSVAAHAHYSLLNGLLIALTAVTLPHLVLVSRNARWLTAQTSSRPLGTQHVKFDT